MDFVAIDVETANSDFASICQIGVVTFRDGKAVEEWRTLINPEDRFASVNVSIHGIRAGHVADAPRYPQIVERLSVLLSGRIVAHHSAFDRTALARVSHKYNLLELECHWLDTVKVARRAWPQLKTGGYGLANLARTFGIGFAHHDAQDDARAAGEILIRAIADTGLPLDRWPVRLQSPVQSAVSNPSSGGNRSRRGNPDGALAGEVVVFTGTLSMPRHQAADLAAEAGCDVSGSVTTKTTLLIVGDLDVRDRADSEKSSKHRKAEGLIEGGQAIRILAESDFVAIVAT